MRDQLRASEGDAEGISKLVGDMIRAHLCSYVLVSVYGAAFKELIREESGDGGISAIDVDMNLVRLPNEKGDRVKIVMSGKYLQYKTY